jgi:2-oxo-4-hydroxy-4-carboxy-5-ureidoimidazoline decarboxylase
MSMLAQFNALPGEKAELELLYCCAAPPWVRQVAAGRPYLDEAALRRAAEQALADLPWRMVAAAVAAHPRIGQPPPGDTREAAASRREQAGTAGDDEAVRAALAAANRAYEARFGHRFLIAAAGRTGAEMLDAARTRLTNDTATERRVVRRELAAITMSRLRGLLSG